MVGGYMQLNLFWILYFNLLSAVVSGKNKDLIHFDKERIITSAIQWMRWILWCLFI